MITYAIISRRGSQHTSQNNLQHADPTTEEGRSLILLRLLRRHRTNLCEGRRIKLRGSPLRGTVTQLLDNPTNIEWLGGQPSFVEVTLDDGSIMTVHPKLLKTKSR